MRERIIDNLDQLKDQTEDIWEKSSSIKNSLRLLGTCLQESPHDNYREMSAITEIYYLLSEILEKKTEHIMHDLSTILADIKQDSAQL